MEILSLAMPGRFPHPLRSSSQLQDLVKPSLQVSALVLTCHVRNSWVPRLKVLYELVLRSN